MWIVRKSLETGIHGIENKFNEMYNIEIKNGYVSINGTIEIPLEAIDRVQESSIEYEIRTAGVFINLSKTQKCVKMLARC